MSHHLKKKMSNDGTDTMSAAYRVWGTPFMVDQICCFASTDTLTKIARTANASFSTAVPLIWCQFDSLSNYEERLSLVSDCKRYMAYHRSIKALRIPLDAKSGLGPVISRFPQLRRIVTTIEGRVVEFSWTVDLCGQIRDVSIAGSFYKSETFIEYLRSRFDRIFPAHASLRLLNLSRYFNGTHMMVRDALDRIKIDNTLLFNSLEIDAGSFAQEKPGLLSTLQEMDKRNFALNIQLFNVRIRPVNGSDPESYLLTEVQQILHHLRDSSQSLGSVHFVVPHVDQFLQLVHTNSQDLRRCKFLHIAIPYHFNKVPVSNNGPVPRTPNVSGIADLELHPETSAIDTGPFIRVDLQLQVQTGEPTSLEERFEAFMHDTALIGSLAHVVLALCPPTNLRMTTGESSKTSTKRATLERLNKAITSLVRHHMSAIVSSREAAKVPGWRRLQKEGT